MKSWGNWIFKIFEILAIPCFIRVNVSEIGCLWNIYNVCQFTLLIEMMSQVCISGNFVLSCDFEVLGGTLRLLWNMWNEIVFSSNIWGQFVISGKLISEYSNCMELKLNFTKSIINNFFGTDVPQNTSRSQYDGLLAMALFCIFCTIRLKFIFLYSPKVYIFLNNSTWNIFQMS